MVTSPSPPLKCLKRPLEAYPVLCIYKAHMFYFRRFCKAKLLCKFAIIFDNNCYIDHNFPRLWSFILDKDENIKSEQNILNPLCKYRISTNCLVLFQLYFSNINSFFLITVHFSFPFYLLLTHNAALLIDNDIIILVNCKILQ